MLIGADPEVFWQNGEGFVSVIEKLGGTKQQALRINECVNVLEDNVAAEFNFPPAESLEDFRSKIHQNLNYLEEQAKKHGATLSKLASGCFPMSELTHPMAFVFGCEPDFNAWTLQQNPAPNSDNLFLRSAGGHIHIGHGKSNPAVIRAADLFLGVGSIFLDPDTERRQLYGRAGACRPKPYGDEYRTLSNFWIFDDDLITWAYQQTNRAVAFAQNNDCIETDSELGLAIQKAINDSDKDAAHFIFKEIPDARPMDRTL